MMSLQGEEYFMMINYSFLFLNQSESPKEPLALRDLRTLGLIQKQKQIINHHRTQRTEGTCEMVIEEQLVRSRWATKQMR